VGEVVGYGATALDFGKSGDGWVWLTTLDTAGSPYLGITTWQGANPYDGGNRSHRLRLGQLSGVSGVHEWGLQAGQSTSNFIRFSDLRSEIHGSRLSLYAGDGGQLQVTAVQVQHYRNATDISFLAPNADHTVQGIVSTGASYYTEVDENPASPTTTNYIHNDLNQSGVVFLGLGNPTWTGSTYQVNIRAHIIVTDVTNDTIRVYGQVFDADEITPLTSEKLIYTATTDTAGTTPNVQCDTVVADASQTRWNAARLRLRWEYVINASEEAIRLDPNTPSIAVGNPLPTGYLFGGAGFWTGKLPGVDAYAVRIGAVGGPNARFDGANFRIANSAGADVFYFPSSGEAYIGAAVNLSTSGGIYQGTGTFSSPTAGLKLWNDSGQGTISLFSGGTAFARLDSGGVQIAGNSSGYSSRSAVTFATAVGGTVWAGIYGSLSATETARITETGLYFAGNATDSKVILASGSTYFVLDSTKDYMRLMDADFYIENRGLAVGYNTTPALNRGQIACDFAGEHDFNALVLQDTTDINHGMSAVVGVNTYGVLGKNHNTLGGLKVAGYSGNVAGSDGVIGLELHGVATLANTTKSGAGLGAVSVHAYKRSGTSVTSYGSTENLFVVRNNNSTKFIVEGDGDFYYDGAGSAYDGEDDVGMLTALAKELWPGVIDQEWHRFITHNRQSLVDAGIISEAGFINGPALLRLIVGALGQLNTRLVNVENGRGITG
jgi:hypothetical protein